MLTALLLFACTDDRNVDSSAGPIEACTASADTLVEIGRVGGTLFTPFSDGESVRLESAPQGGQGVSVALRTGGVSTEGAVDVLLEPYWNGAVQGSFVSEGLPLYCTEEDNGDQYGRVTGTVVGFDPDLYVTDDDLAVLDGETIDLLVGLTSSDGAYAEGHVDVVIEF